MIAHGNMICVIIFPWIANVKEINDNENSNNKMTMIKITIIIVIAVVVYFLSTNSFTIAPKNKINSPILIK